MIISETSKLMLNTFQYGARTSSPAVFRIRIALFGSVVPSEWEQQKAFFPTIGRWESRNRQNYRNRKNENIFIRNILPFPSFQAYSSDDCEQYHKGSRPALSEFAVQLLKSHYLSRMKECSVPFWLMQASLGCKIYGRFSCCQVALSLLP
jgi:hypothetical protein